MRPSLHFGKPWLKYLSRNAASAIGAIWASGKLAAADLRFTCELRFYCA